MIVVDVERGHVDGDQLVSSPPRVPPPLPRLVADVVRPLADPVWVAVNAVVDAAGVAGVRKAAQVPPPPATL